MPADPLRVVGVTEAGLGVLGSPPYMSPEQAAGAVESLGPATDVYGLGAILFALLTAEPPVADGSAEDVLDRARRDPDAEQAHDAHRKHHAHHLGRVVSRLEDGPGR